LDEDRLIHLAALSNDPLGALAPDLTYDINHRASVRLARLARDAGVARFLYASTCSVYGASGGSGLVTEDAPLRPATPYAESKVLVESDVHELADDHFTPVYMRNATAFGYSPRLRADIVLNNLVGHAYLSGEVLVLSDGTPWRPLVHAGDIARAFAAALVAPREAVHDKAFNIGTERNNVTVAEIANEVVEAVPGSRVRITGEAGADLDLEYRAIVAESGRAADLKVIVVPESQLGRYRQNKNRTVELVDAGCRGVCRISRVGWRIGGSRGCSPRRLRA